MQSPKKNRKKTQKTMLTFIGQKRVSKKVRKVLNIISKIVLTIYYVHKSFCVSERFLKGILYFNIFLGFWPKKTPLK